MVEAVAGAVGSVANMGGAIAGIFGKKQEAKLQQEVTKTSRTEGILALKQKQIEQERERAKQQASTQMVMYIILAVLFLALIAGIVIYKIYKKNG